MLSLHRILHPTDFSDGSRRAFGDALDLARRFGAEVHLLHVVAIPGSNSFEPMLFVPPSDLLKRVEQAALAAMGEWSARAGDLTLHQAVETGLSVDDVVVRYAEEHEVDLVVMGTHGSTGATRVLLGSVAERVVRTARCPVLTVPERGPSKSLGTAEAVLAAVDFSPASERALLHARELARSLSARLEIAHVVEEPPWGRIYGYTGALEELGRRGELEDRAQRRLNALLAEHASGRDVVSHLVSGRPATAIVELAQSRGIDVLVLGTEGLTGAERLLLGSTAEKVLRLAPCAVLTVGAAARLLVRER